MIETQHTRGWVLWAHVHSMAPKEWLNLDVWEATRKALIKRVDWKLADDLGEYRICRFDHDPNS